jgi:hypothetical protein
MGKVLVDAGLREGGGLFRNWVFRKTQFLPLVVGPRMPPAAPPSSLRGVVFSISFSPICKQDDIGRHHEPKRIVAGYWDMIKHPGDPEAK